MAETFTIDSSRFNASAAALADVVKINGAQILAEEARQFLMLAQNSAPPLKFGSKSGTTAYATGLGAVSGDLRRAMHPITPGQLTRNKRMAEIVRAGDKEAWNAVAAKIKSGPLAKTVAIDFSVSAHTSQRNAYGRVKYDHNKVVFDARKWESYRQELRGRVGILKSGWNAAMLNPDLQRGGKKGMTVPAYVKRHGVKFSSADINLSGDRPYVDITNKAVKWPSYEKVVNNAFRMREKAIQTKMKRILQGKATNLGFAHTLGG